MPCTSPSSTDQIVLSCNQLFNNSQSSLQSGFIIVSSYNQTPCLIACLFCPIHWLNCLKEVKYPCFHQFKNFSMRVCLSTLFLICQCQGSLGHLCLQCQIKGAFSCHIQCRWWKGISALDHQGQGMHTYVSGLSFYHLHCSGL